MKNITPSAELGELAQLVADSARQGADLGNLVAIIEKASEVGAVKALDRCGLHDDTAGRDIRELRDLLDAWREARRTAWRTLVKWAVTLVLALILAGIAMRVRLPFFNN